MQNKLGQRFIELEQQMRAVEESCRTSHSNYGSSTNVDSELYLEWVVKVKSLLVKVCGIESEHYKEFEKPESRTSMSGNSGRFKSQKAVFLAAKEDFEGGYLSSYKTIVQAEVFDDELEQAQELLECGYYGPAAVVAGVVLETSIRSVCHSESIDTGKLDKMNSDLAKKGIYNKLVQKQITALAGIRNSAAHGNYDEFSTSDVEQMIVSIRNIVGNHLNV